MPDAYPETREPVLVEAAMARSPVAYAYFDAADRLRHWNRAYEELNFRIRGHIRQGAYFPDLLAELVVQGQIEITGQTTGQWIDERLRARREGGLAFRRLANRRIYLVHERKDEVGGTLGFWLNVTELVQIRSLVQVTEGTTIPPNDLADHGLQNRLRTQLQIMQGNLELLGRDATDVRTANLADEALQAGSIIADILTSCRQPVG